MIFLFKLSLIVGLILLALQYYTCHDVDTFAEEYGFYFDKKTVVIMSIPFGLYYLLIKRTIKNYYNDKKRNLK